MLINSTVGEKRKSDGITPANQKHDTENEIIPPSSKRQRNLQQDIRLFINKKVMDRNGRIEPTECGTAEPTGNENADSVQRDENPECGTAKTARTGRVEPTECGTAEPASNGRAEPTECGTAEAAEKENADSVQRD